MSIKDYSLKYICVVSQRTFQRCFNVAFWLIQRHDEEQRQIKVE